MKNERRKNKIYCKITTINDVLDNLVGVNQGNQTRTFVYDGLSRLTSQTTPEGGTVTFTYTSFDAVQTRTDARGAVTSYGYDALNRLQSVTYNTSSAPGVATTSGVTINYRTSAPGKGQISSIADGLGSESYGYDSMARVSSKTRTIDTRSYQSQYQYNGANQLTLMIYPSGKRVRVNRDTRGRLSGLDKVDASNNVLLGYMSSVGYNTAGQVTGLTLGNGVAESYGYSNDRLQLTSQSATKGAATLMSLSYGYSASSGASGVGTAAGNSGQLMTITGTINSQTRNQAFTYDNVGRLLTATGWSAWQRRFSYDRWGNRTGMWNATTGGSQLQAITMQMSGSAPTNRISNVNGVSYVYDSSGNVTNDGAYAYTYDAESRLVSVSVGGSGSYGYDSANRRVKKTASGVTTHYVWEGDQVVAEYDGTSGALISEYVYAGSRMVAREQSSTIRYYHADRLSTRMITDGAGAVVGTEDHLPFGEDAGVVGENEKHRFTTYERDSESGTDYAVNRQHSFNTGRFMQPDPILGDIDIPQSLNRYAYAQNEPVDLTDPLGLQVYCFGYFLTIIYVQDGKIIGREPTQFFPVFCVDIGGPEEGASKGVAAALSSEAKQALDPCAKKRAEARKQVDELLAKTGLDKFIKEKRVSESGKGYILEFKDIQAARKFVESSALFTGGGSFGGLLHINELKRNGDKGPFSDFRSFTGSSGTGKRSLQVTFGGRLAFVDSDKFNYRQDAFGFFGHTFGEVLPGLFKKLFGKKDC